MTCPATACQPGSKPLRKPPTGHLLALAAKHGAKLATLDPGIPGALLIG